VAPFYVIPDNIALFFANTLQRNNIVRLPDIEILIDKDISQLNIVDDENVPVTDGSESASGVLDLTGNLEVHMTSLRRIQLHMEDISIQHQDSIQGIGALNVSTEENQQEPVFQSTTLIRWETNGSASDPSAGTSSSPISGSCSTTEEQSQGQYLHNNCMWESQSLQQQAFMYMNMNNGGMVQEMVPGVLQGSVSPQYSYDPYANIGMQNASWEIPYHQRSMQYGIEETMWKQSQEWEMTYPGGSNSPYRSCGTGMYMNAGVNGLHLSPRVGLDDVNMQRGTGTYLPSMVIGLFFFPTFSFHIKGSMNAKQYYFLVWFCRVVQIPKGIGVVGMEGCGSKPLCITCKGKTVIITTAVGTGVQI
jgi:hypothetical protein